MGHCWDFAEAGAGVKYCAPTGGCCFAGGVGLIADSNVDTCIDAICETADFMPVFLDLRRLVLIFLAFCGRF